MIDTGPDPKPPGRRSFRADEDAAAPASSRLSRGDFRPDRVVNPPPKFLPVAYRLPPDPMIDAVIEAFRTPGMLLESIDRAEGLVKGTHDMGGGVAATVTVSVVPTDAGGSRMLLSYDRPPGSRMDPAADERQLKALLDRVDAALAKSAGG